MATAGAATILSAIKPLHTVEVFDIIAGSMHPASVNRNTFSQLNELLSTGLKGVSKLHLWPQGHQTKLVTALLVHNAVSSHHAI
jgi:hypothetical protein